MEQVRVAVRAVDPVTAVGLAAYLRTRPDVRVLPENRAGEAEVFVLAADSMTPDLMALLRRTAEESAVRTVLVVSDINEQDLLPAIECGVFSILGRGELTCDRLVSAVFAARKGAAQMSGDLLGSLLAQVKRIQQEVLKPRGLTASGLAEREVDLLKLLAEGWDTEEIALRLAYSERTVKSMVHGVLQRYQLRNRAHAVAYAMRAGVI